MEERDPLKSQAIESSLWELQALQNHILPNIATAAKFIHMPLPSVEWDMGKILENSADDVSKTSVTNTHQFVKWVLFFIICMCLNLVLEVCRKVLYVIALHINSSYCMICLSYTAWDKGRKCF
jgi:hypothetical protein